MYKVSEVAEMLAVEKVKIFEALIVHDELLSPFVIKERHLSYITEDGVRTLEKILFGIEAELEDNTIVEEVEIEVVFEEDHLDHLDQFIRRNDEKKNLYKNEIIDLKRQINILDKEMRLKDEAISRYQEIFSDDLKWMAKFEVKSVLTKTENVNEFEKKNSFFNRLKK